MSQEKVFAESLKLWGEFSNNYTGLVRQTMAQTLKQSESFQAQLNQVTENTLKAWQAPAPPSDQDKILEALALIQGQLQDLNQRVAKLEQNPPA